MNNQSESIAKCVSILGTGSDVGKSIVAAALCRIFVNQGINVAPFKAQNMSNNSWVTDDGGEMGRAQVVQAQAAKIEPHVDMNPVLLKPSSQTGSQVILHGQPIYNVTAADYYKDAERLFQESMQSLDRLRNKHKLIVMEGAGSCGEVNLLKRDFVNFKTAEAADAPVFLVADIDRGGVFAQIIGTLAVIPPSYRERVKGFIINRFRGDPSLFREGIDYIETETGRPVIGLVPFYDHIVIESEDSVLLQSLVDPNERPVEGKINMAVIRLPHISNYTDFAPLEIDPMVNLHYLSTPRSLSGYDIVFLPGSKNVRNDLRWINETGWQAELKTFREKGGEIGGICGGYQLLGKTIKDPGGVEGPPGEEMALGLLDLTTTMKSKKTLSRSVGSWLSSGELVEGYEIHMGETQKAPSLKPLIHLISRNKDSVSDTDGVISEDGKVWGTYFHGLFNKAGLRRSFLKRLKPDYAPSPETNSDFGEFRDKQYDLLADHFTRYLDLEKLNRIIGI